MNQKRILTFLLLTTAILLLFNCGGPSPFPPKDARIDLFLETSLGQRSFVSITDTVEKQVRVGMTAYLQVYITSVVVTIEKNTTEIDTIKTFDASTIWADTQWIDIRFHSMGTRKVTVVVSIQNEQPKADTASITIVGKPIQMVADPVSAAINEGMPDTFFVKVNGSGTAFVYQWYKDGSAISGATKDTLIINPALFANSGRYTCVIKDQWGDSVTSAPALLNVSPNQAINHPPTLRLLSGSKNVQPGQTCMLVFAADDVDTGTIFTYSALKGKPAAASFADSTFAWTPGSGDTGTFPIDFIVADNGKPLMYDTLSVNITVNSQSIKTPPIIMVLQDTSVAQGKTLAFIVKTIAPAQDTVVLSATDITGAKLPDSATFNSKTGLFSWTPTFSQLGLYKILFTAANGNAVAKDTVKITVTKTDRPPTVQAQSVNTSINQAITVTLVASDPDNDSILQWQLSQKPHNGTATLADSTKGSVVYTPNSGFTGMDTFTVRAYDGSLWSLAPANVIVTITSIKIAPKIQTQPRPDTTVSQGGSVAFTVAINNASPSPAFIWYQGSKGSGTMKDSSTNPLYQKTGVTAADSGNYYVIVVNSSGADTSAYAHLKVNVPPSAPTLVSPANGASGQPVSITLVWNKVALASAYYLQVSSDSGFAAMVVSDSTQTDTAKAVTGCANGSTYYWRVNAKSASGTSVWSGIRKFTTIRQFSLAVTATNGTVTKMPNSLQYDSGTVVGLKALPNTGYQFVNWTGDATGSTDSTTVVMNSTKSVAANFSLISYQLTTAAGTGGSVSTPATSPVTVNYGAATTITATPTTGYAFANWTVTSGTATIANAGSATTTITLTSGNATVTANFMSQTNSLAVAAGTGGTITAPASSPLTVTYGVPTTITAAPSAGYTFVNWTVTSGTANIASATSMSTTVTISDGSAAVTANFTPITYQLTVTAGTGGSITAPTTSPATVNYGAATTITAAPSTGYSFVNWTVTSGTATIAAATSATTTVTLTSGNATVTASFAIITYQLTTTAGTGGTITAPASSPATVNYGAATTITAAPSTGYSFVNWTVTSGTATIAAATSATTTLTLTSGNAAVTANFAIITYQLTTAAGTGGTITTPATSPTTVNYGAATTITAAPSSGYKFIKWTRSQTTGVSIGDSTSASTTVTLTSSNATVTANFQQLMCSWTSVFDFSTNSDYPYSIAANENLISVGTRKYGIEQSQSNGGTGTWVPSNLSGATDVIALSQFGSLTLAGSDGSGFYPPGIFASRSFGVWDTSRTGSNGSVYAFAQNGTTYYAGTDAGVLVSNDSGRNWQVDGTYWTATVIAMVVNGSTLYASSSGTLYSRNVTSTVWAAVSGAPSGITSLFMRGSTLFAGTVSGIYLHNSGTGNWDHQANSGLTGSVTGYAVGGYYIFAGTSANGIFVSSDNGANWVAVNGGLVSGSSTSVIAMAANSTAVFMISGREAFKSPLP